MSYISKLQFNQKTVKPIKRPLKASYPHSKMWSKLYFCAAPEDIALAVGGSFCSMVIPTCWAYSKREIRYGAGGRRPGYTALLIESKASVKRPHSIMQPTLLKSIFVAWRNTRTMIKCKRYMESRRKHSTQRDGWQKDEGEKSRGQKGNGNRKWMGFKSSWGSFLTVCYGQMA